MKLGITATEVALLGITDHFYLGFSGLEDTLVFSATRLGSEVNTASAAAVMPNRPKAETHNAKVHFIG
jgi:hypothetical protein